MWLFLKESGTEYDCQMRRLYELLESSKIPISPGVYECSIDFAGALQSLKSTSSSSPIIENLLAEYKVPEKKLADILISFRGVRSRASQKLMKPFDIPEKNLDFSKITRIFDTRK